MDFQLNEEQIAIRDMADSLFSDFTADEQLLAFTETQNTVMQDAWDAAKETGLDLLFVPEVFGGSGLGMQELSLVLIAQGARLAQLPLWRNQVAVKILAEHADSAALLESVISDGALITTSHDAAFSAKGVQLTSHGDGTVSGYVHSVADVCHSRYALLTMQSSEQRGLVLVDLEDERVDAVPGVATHGGAVADLHLSNVTPLVTMDNAAFNNLVVYSVACLSSLQLGVSERQLSRTVEYVNERVQFDRAIGTFQAVQMTLADCYIAIEALRSCLWQLNYRLDAGLPAYSEALSTAHHACEAGHFVSHKAQHVHGGFGVDISYPIYRFLYWSRDIRASLGGAQAVLAELGDWLTKNETLGWKYDLE